VTEARINTVLITNAIRKRQKKIYLGQIFVAVGRIKEVTVNYPLDNEVAKGYSNATVRPSVRRHILLNTLGSTSFNGFLPSLVLI
jgi:hypothetical protein